MSKFFVGFLNAAQLTALHNAGHAVEAFALSEPQRLVATLKSTSIGATVAAEIKTLTDKSIPGAQKFAQVLAIATPLVLHYATNPGGAIVADAEAVARELIQSVFNDVVGAVKAALPAPVDAGKGYAPSPAPVSQAA